MCSQQPDFVQLASYVTSLHLNILIYKTGNSLPNTQGFSYIKSCVNILYFEIILFRHFWQEMKEKRDFVLALPR